MAVLKVFNGTEWVRVGFISDKDKLVALDQTEPQTIIGGTPKLDVLKSKTILGTDAEGKIIEGTHQDLSGYAKLDGATFTGDISAPNLSGINTGDQDLSNLVEEALEDDKQYVRKNGAWEEVNIPASHERGTFTLSNLKYIFTIDTPNNAPVTGDTYTNNDITYTVISYSDNILICSGNGYPTVIGTLTKVSGSGDDTLTFNSYKATLTVEHNLNLSAPYSICGISLFNNLGKQFLPDDIAGFANSFEVDLTSFRDLTGTNGYIYIKG